MLIGIAKRMSQTKAMHGAMMSHMMSWIIARRTRIIVLLLVSMVTLWLLTIAEMCITKFPPDSFYFATQLPIYYWAGLVLGCSALWLLVSSSSKGRHSAILDICFIIILAMYLFGIPSFVYANPRFMDVYGVIDRIIQTIEVGHIIPYGGWDREFPLQAIFPAQISLILGTSVFQLARFFPLIHVLLVSFLIYAISRKMLSQYYILAPALYLSISWMPAHHLSPQSYGLMLTAVFLFLLIARFMDKPATTKKLLLIAIMATTVLSHAPTPLINLVPLLLMVVLSCGSTFWQRKVISTKQVAMVTTVYAVMYFGYLHFNASDILAVAVSQIQTSLNNLHGGNILVTADWTVTEPMRCHVFITWLRLLSVVSVCLVGLVSILLLFKKKYDRFAFLISCLFLGYISLSVAFFATQNITFVERGFVFALVPFSILIPLALSAGIRSKLSKVFGLICGLLLIFHLFLAPLTARGVDPYMVPSKSEIAGREFVVRNRELKRQIDFRVYGAPVVFQTIWYNYLSLKHQMGEEYANQFEVPGLDKVYNSGQFRVFLPRDKNVFQKLLEVWHYTGFREPR
ncbi:MAG: hypothetical protein DDT30_00571 [Dehalococcoidia bacterium]|nr:hypothetical protein [Bacillota bacterium]MBT9142019.1 hypothetical protein [Bacillota bacterium]